MDVVVTITSPVPYATPDYFLQEDPGFEQNGCDFAAALSQAKQINIHSSSRLHGPSPWRGWRALAADPGFELAEGERFVYRFQVDGQDQLRQITVALEFPTPGALSAFIGGISGDTDIDHATVPFLYYYPALDCFETTIEQRYGESCHTW